MRWQHPRDKTYEWTSWFAWHPIQLTNNKTGTITGGPCVWLELVERRRYETWGGGGWDYR